MIFRWLWRGPIWTSIEPLHFGNFEWYNSIKIHSGEGHIDWRERPNQRGHRVASGTAAVALTLSSVKFQFAMDLFEHRYYKFNKTLMKLFGYWPYQNTYTRVTLSVIPLILLFSQILPQTLAFVKYHDDPKIFSECFITFTFEVICTIKALSLAFNAKKASY